MRYRDAAHVDTGSFYSRRHVLGGWYRIAGHLAAVAAALVRPDQLAWLLPVLVVAWLAAWFQVVGTLWRASLVAAILIAAVRLGHAACCGVPA
jgi:hypothetical protein